MRAWPYKQRHNCTHYYHCEQNREPSESLPSAHAVRWRETPAGGSLVAILKGSWGVGSFGRGVLRVGEVSEGGTLTMGRGDRRTWSSRACVSRTRLAARQLRRSGQGSVHHSTRKIIRAIRVRKLRTLQCRRRGVDHAKHFLGAVHLVPVCQTFGGLIFANLCQ